MIICSCNGITETQVKEIVLDGYSNTQEVLHVLATEMDCGSCEQSIQGIIDDAYVDDQPE